MHFRGIRDQMPELARYRAADFDLIHVNIGDSDILLERMVRSLASYRAWLTEHAEHYVLVSGAADIVRAKHEGKLGVCFDIEGAQAFEKDLDLIPRFYALGVRWLLVAYNRANLLAGGCHDPVDTGLTEFGKRFLAEMDQVGMIKDVGSKAHSQLRDCGIAPGDHRRLIESINRLGGEENSA